MCNVYRITPKRGATKTVAGRASDAASKLPSGLVRKSDPGIVMLPDGRFEMMRWGFHREFNPSINNARSDKLEAGMWAEAFHARRCVIPMTLFYEWGEGAGGKKQPHEFHDPEDGYLWAAGIWETHAEFGPCYTMVTTAASPQMAPIHHRMPALLSQDEMQDFVTSTEPWDFQPYAGPLASAPCESPLAKRRSDSDEQPELF